MTTLLLRALRRSAASALLLACTFTPVLTAPALAADRALTPPPATKAAPESVPQAAHERLSSDRWYVLLLQGQRAGHLRSTERTEDGRITSSSDVILKIKRERLTISVAVQTEFVETLEGNPLSMKSVSKLGAMETKRELTFNSNGTVTSVSTQATPSGPVTSTDTRPMPTGDWLTPAAAARKVKAGLAAGAKTMTLRVLDPSLGEAPVTITRTIIETTTAEAFGRVVPAVKWKTTVDALAGTDVTELVAEQGETIRSEINLGGISLVQLAADKELALSKLDAPELLASTLVTPDRPISGARTLRQATYRVSSTKGDLPEMPSVTGQRFERETPTAALLYIDARDNGAEGVKPELADATRAEFMILGPMVNHQDPKIIELAAGIESHGRTPSQVAEQARRFVHSFISAKDLSVGFASASEVCRTRAGDCTEHAVLLAAILRAKGVPSRVASGLVYADQFAGMSGVFGYHMWTQALVEAPGGGLQWINLDATLPDIYPYDATHLIISTSSLADGQSQNFLVATAPLIGKLKIEVIKP